MVSPTVASASLVKKTYDRKARKEREQQRQKEEDERRQAALDTLDPPLEDARPFAEPQEREEFERSIPGAVDASLEKGDEYLRDRRAYAHCRWLDKFQSRGEEPERRHAARAEASRFPNWLIHKGGNWNHDCRQKSSPRETTSVTTLGTGATAGTRSPVFSRMAESMALTPCWQRLSEGYSQTPSQNSPLGE